MHTVNAYAATQAKSPLQPFQIQRREPGPNDVVIAIEYCGICHSDIQKAQFTSIDHRISFQYLGNVILALSSDDLIYITIRNYHRKVIAYK